MSLRQWFSLSQQIDSAVIWAVAQASFYFKVEYLVFVLSHAVGETWNPVAIVGIAGTLLSTTCAQDTPTFNLFFSLGLVFSAMLVHSVYHLHGFCTLSSGILNIRGLSASREAFLNQILSKTPSTLNDVSTISQLTSFNSSSKDLFECSIKAHDPKWNELCWKSISAKKYRPENNKNLWGDAEAL